MDAETLLKNTGITSDNVALKKDQLIRLLDIYGAMKWQQAQTSAKDFATNKRADYELSPKNLITAYQNPSAIFTPYNKK